MPWQYKVGLVVSVALSATAAFAESDFEYFKNPALNYWGQDVNLVKPETPRLHSVKQNSPAESKAGQSGFQWNKYLSPNNDEFFKEGDYTPPAPFMEIARNPTDDNIEHWFSYLQTKNELLHRLQEKLTEFAAHHPQHIPGMSAQFSGGSDTDMGAVKQIAARLESPPLPAADVKRFRLRLYFDSHCPHCEHMMGTISELMQLGYWVELRQIDKDVAARSKIPFPVTGATPDEVHRYQIESVPVLLVGDLKAKTYFKIQGYQSTAAVVSALRQH